MACRALRSMEESVRRMDALPRRHYRAGFTPIDGPRAGTAGPLRRSARFARAAAGGPSRGALDGTGRAAGIADGLGISDAAAEIEEPRRLIGRPGILLPIL